LLRERVGHEIDDELLVGADVGPRILWLAWRSAAVLNADRRRIGSDDIEEGNGAAFTTPVASRVVIQAIGRGKTVANSSL
jgi:hypothetical protein